MASAQSTEENFSVTDTWELPSEHLDSMSSSNPILDHSPPHLAPMNEDSLKLCTLSPGLIPVTENQDENPHQTFALHPAVTTQPSADHKRKGHHGMPTMVDLSLSSLRRLPWLVSLTEKAKMSDDMDIKYL
eukprot:3470680-Ditylum_brightwellii.AAC.1